jgi:hypothetical protein
MTTPPLPIRAALTEGRVACLVCDWWPAGTEDAGAPAHAHTAEDASAQARAHTAETAHPTVYPHVVRDGGLVARVIRVSGPS